MDNHAYFNGKLIWEFKSFLPLIVILVLSANLLQSQCPPYLYFTTQAEIDIFPINYPNCTEIEGGIWIFDGSDSDITNLDGLSNIESIGDLLAIEGCPLLEEINGLANLISVGNSVTIGGCTVLEDLNGLGSLISIGNQLIIWNCPLLENVDGFSNLTNVQGEIKIENCSNLKNLYGLENVSSFNGFQIMGCDSLINLHGLENISSTADLFIVTNCQSLIELTSFPNLNYIDATLGITNLPALMNVSGLENLDSISGPFYLGDNTSLTNVDGLDGLKSVGLSLQIHHNYSLENLNGLNGLQSVGWDLMVNKCNSLVSLTGLESLQYIGSDLQINENNSLQSLTGIDNIEAESIMNLSITYNPQLSTCEVQSVCDYLANPNGDIQIYVNAQGCNNSVEVEEACTVGIPDHRSDPQLSAYPNPFTTSTTIEYELTEPSHVQLIIYNAIGETILMAVDRLMPQGKHNFIWNPEGLPEGLYYAVLRSKEGVSVVKMIKQ